MQTDQLQSWPLEEIHLSCDALVLRPEELVERLSDGSRMAEELNRDLRWII